MPEDPSTWSLYDWYSQVSVEFWISVIVGLISVLIASFHFGKRTEGKRKEISIQRLEEELRKEQERPLTVISISKEAASISKYSSHLKYSFTGDNIIHPNIIMKLLGWLGDALPVVGAFDLEGAMLSDAYDESFLRKEDEDGLTMYQIQTGLSDLFAYTYLGASSTGLHVIKTLHYWGGTTGVCYDILLIVLETDRVVTSYDNEQSYRDRILLKCVGHIPLGDTYKGKVEFKANKLYIEKNNHPIGGTWPDNVVIQIE